MVQLFEYPDLNTKAHYLYVAGEFAGRGFRAVDAANM